ncbi:probable signal peptidase complex subunit 1 [Coccomyxa sp. Obi]|nr:probable signal peptidase complex subunit 1 [Coccomyxa sp. Obi]
MDFQGQKLAEQLCLYIICAAGAVAFALGWAEGSFALMMKVYGSGVAVAMVACVPDWPWFNRHPLKWLPSAPEQSEQRSNAHLSATKQRRTR